MQAFEVHSDVRDGGGQRTSQTYTIGVKHVVAVGLVSFVLGAGVSLLVSSLHGSQKGDQGSHRGPNGPKKGDQQAGYPPKYGKIPEKTIWFFYDKGFDPMPNRLVELCVQTFCVNNPDWNFEFLSDSNVLEYVSEEMLPSAYWTWRPPANKKDMVMANVLALYGGVAADATILNFKSLNVLWNRMLKDGADAVIYWYRFIEPWPEVDSSAAWFFMARRDAGIFRRYAQDIKTHFGNAKLDVSRVGGDAYLAFATGSVEPILIEINSSLPLCMTDPTVDPSKKCAMSMKDHVAANQDLSNTKVVFLDPNDQAHGPQLNTWPALCINNDKERCPIPRLSRPSAAELWEQYQSRKEDPYFTMIKLFGGGGRFAKESPDLLLPSKDDDRENVMSMWFKDAGLELDKPNYCGDKPKASKGPKMKSEASASAFTTEHVLNV